MKFSLLKCSYPELEEEEEGGGGGGGSGGGEGEEEEEEEWRKRRRGGAGEEDEEEEGDHILGLGTRAGSTHLFSTTVRFCDIKQRQNCSFLTFISIAITSITIQLSGVLLEMGHVFLMRFIVRV